MRFYFEGSAFEKPVTLWIDRKSKILHIACLKTNFSKIRINWKNLFDKGVEEEQDNETEILPDEDFRKKVTDEMALKIYESIQRKEKASFSKAYKRR